MNVSGGGQKEEEEREIMPSIKATLSVQSQRKIISAEKEAFYQTKNESTPLNCIVRG